MSSEDLVKFGPEDANGFRSFSFYTDRGESTRVSLNFSVLREYITRTAGDLSMYSDDEQKSLKTAAKLLAARTPDELVVREQLDAAQLIDLSLTNLLQNTAEVTLRSIESWYPPLAKLALQAVSDACVKKSLNIVSEGMGAPIVTTKKSVDIILDDFCEAVRAFLNKAGRPPESGELIQDVQEAVRRLEATEPGKNPTQQKVAEELGIDPRTLRARLATSRIRWDDLLRLCGCKKRK
jgi:hypothetical protein